jgi:hypothetical protein
VTDIEGIQLHPDPYPDLPHHVHYTFSGGKKIGSARCTGCRETWRGDTPLAPSFEEWYRDHIDCAEKLTAT